MPLSAIIWCLDNLKAALNHIERDNSSVKKKIELKGYNNEYEKNFVLKKITKIQKIMLPTDFSAVSLMCS